MRFVQERFCRFIRPAKGRAPAVFHINPDCPNQSACSARLTRAFQKTGLKRPETGLGPVWARRLTEARKGLRPPVLQTVRAVRSTCSLPLSLPCFGSVQTGISRRSRPFPFPASGQPENVSRNRRLFSGRAKTRLSLSGFMPSCLPPNRIPRLRILPVLPFTLFSHHPGNLP